MLASLLCLGDALVDTKMPVHVSRLLLTALLIRLEASPALGTGRTKIVIEQWY
jgi:hypothetical protein